MTCDPTPDPVPATPRLQTRVGTPVTLSVIFPARAETIYTWYGGRIGDTNAPLRGTSSELVFTPDSPGTHFVWVSVATPCSVREVEFRVDADVPRRRATRS